MAAIKVLNMAGSEVGSIELNDNVFGVAYRESLIHQAVVTRLANERQGTKSTLTRSEVRGGGIKPWRQKGTGRARQGSIRSPQWTGGGVVFAPKPRDFSQKVNKYAKRSALASALTGKLNDNDIVVVDALNLEQAKTKEMVKILAALNIEKRVLVVITDEDKAVVRAANNIPCVKTINSSLINVYDIVANAKVLMTKAAVEKIQEAYKA